MLTTLRAIHSQDMCQQLQLQMQRKKSLPCTLGFAWPQCVLILSGVTFVVGAALSAGAEHISMVVLGRLVLGLGVGGGTTVRAQPHPAHSYASGFYHMLFRAGMVWSWVGSTVGFIAW